MAITLGVDFGTTRTVVACPDRGNYPVIAFSDTEGDYHDYFPSVIAAGENGLLYGFQAQEAMQGGIPGIRSFKRLLSSANATANTQVQIGDCSYPLSEIVTGFLHALRVALHETSSLSGQFPIDEAQPAVVAVPAHAYTGQRLLTLDAFRAAGFKVSAMINEPSAAGFEYTHRKASTVTSRRSRVLVYDLGGGTFDVSLVDVEERNHAILGTQGLNNVGGDDFDLVIAELALASAGVKEEDLNSAQINELLRQCCDAKEGLSPQTRRVVVEVGEDPVILPVTEIYEACTPLVLKTMEAMEPLIGRLESGLPDLTEIAGIYLVGGASSLPIVPRLLRERFGRRVHRSPLPGASTAIGLAIAADSESGYSLRDRLSHGFGVFREADGGARLVFDEILSADYELSENGEKVEIRRDYWAAHNLGWFRFVECAGVDAYGEPRGDLAPYAEIIFPFDRSLRTESELHHLQVEHCEQYPHIEECYSVTPDGIVTVTITDLDDGYSRSYMLGNRIS